jgi:cytochrome b561
VSREVQWDPVIKTLHWVILLMVFVEVPVGYLMAGLYGPSLQQPQVKPIQQLLAQVHQTNGFLLLVLMIVRLLWRWRHAAPWSPSDVERWRRRAAKTVQGMLYVVLIALPMTGWLSLSVLADSVQFGRTQIWFFGTDDWVPRIATPLPFNDPQGYARFARWHIWLVYGGAALLALHVATAMYHRWIARDGVFARMWPTGRSETSRPL